MMLRGKIHALIAGLSMSLAGCSHAGKQVKLAVAPRTAPEIAPVMVSVPPPTHRDRTGPGIETATVTTVPAEAPRRTSRTPKHSTPSALPATPTAPPQQQASVEAPITLGELSAGGETSTAQKQQTADLLRSQQQRLDGLNHDTIASHPKEIAQVKGFLKKAEESWNAADYEGSHTLVVKAKVLLDDIQR